MGWVEGEGFAAAGLAVAGFLNPSDFVVKRNGRTPLSFGQHFEWGCRLCRMHSGG